jgi:hypothetical protein
MLTTLTVMLVIGWFAVGVTTILRHESRNKELRAINVMEGIVCGCILGFIAPIIIHDPVIIKARNKKEE